MKEAIPTVSHTALSHTGMRNPGMFCERVIQAAILDGRIGSAAQFIWLCFAVLIRLHCVAPRNKP